ncbi:INCE protein, partial [Brachypteracias leptosomus]|nr:INCE protein [Brachypteracias leptosomus]
IKNFIRRNTPSRPDLKSKLLSLQERERQRLESLRKKQEAEEQRKKKVEEEKKRRQAEMKQKREERLRKALQARERVEQMEEQKKKRMEQKILQNDEKVRLSQVREEKVSEERSRKKLSKKLGETEARKQKVLKEVRATPGFSFLQEEEEQQEPLQKRREDEVKEKGRKVWELKNLVEQQQVEHMRYWLASEEESPKGLYQLHGQEKRAKQLESIAVASNPWLRVVKVSVCSGDLADLDLSKDRTWSVGHSGARALRLSWWLWWSLARLGSADCSRQSHLCFQRSISTSCLGPPEEPRSPKVNENNYGMDLNSDDSTDDENDPRKPVPAWADGSQLNQAILHQYYHPVNTDQVFGLIPSPKLEDIFGKSKPRYFKRTSSAVWHSPP